MKQSDVTNKIIKSIREGVEDTLTQLESALKSHDWYYVMSDDNRVYQKGEDSMRKIKDLLTKVEKEGQAKEAKELIAKYKPVVKENEEEPKKTLSKSTLELREKVLKGLKDKKSSLVKRYGKDAEKVMYGRATNIAKKQDEESHKQKIKEAIKNALTKPDKYNSNDNESFIPPKGYKKSKITDLKPNIKVYIPSFKNGKSYFQEDEIEEIGSYLTKFGNRPEIILKNNKWTTWTPSDLYIKDTSVNEENKELEDEIVSGLSLGDQIEDILTDAYNDSESGVEGHINLELLKKNFIPSLLDFLDKQKINENELQTKDYSEFLPKVGEITKFNGIEYTVTEVDPETGSITWKVVYDNPPKIKEHIDLVDPMDLLFDFLTEKLNLSEEEINSDKVRDALYDTWEDMGFDSYEENGQTISTSDYNKALSIFTEKIGKKITENKRNSLTEKIVSKLRENKIPLYTKDIFLNKDINNIISDEENEKLKLYFKNIQDEEIDNINGKTAKEASFIIGPKDYEKETLQHILMVLYPEKYEAYY